MGKFPLMEKKKTENHQPKPFIGILTKVNLLVCDFEKKCVAASETLLNFTLNWNQQEYHLYLLSSHYQQVLTAMEQKQGLYISDVS